MPGSRKFTSNLHLIPHLLYAQARQLQLLPAQSSIWKNCGLSAPRFEHPWFERPTYDGAATVSLSSHEEIWERFSLWYKLILLCFVGYLSRSNSIYLLTIKLLSLLCLLPTPLAQVNTHYFAIFIRDPRRCIVLLPTMMWMPCKGRVKNMIHTNTHKRLPTKKIYWIHLIICLVGCIK